MAFSYVQQFSNRELVCHEKFRSLYRERVRPYVSKRIIEEFRNNPRGYSGHHSDDLQRVLKFLRTLPLDGFPIIYVDKPFERYHLAYVKDIRQVQVDRSRSFSSEADAAYQVFIRRLEVAGLEIANV